MLQPAPSFWQGRIFAPAISAFPTSLWVMPESSHMDVKPWTGIEPKSCSNGIGKLPSPSATLRTGMALDTGILAGMTVLVEASSYTLIGRFCGFQNTYKHIIYMN
jgi:hypothetical protein